jgi:hypothetical protein
MNNNNQSSNNPGSRDLLTKFAAITYNAAGFLPSKVTFNVTLSQLKPIVLKSVQEFVDEIQNVTFITNSKSGEIATFVWLPSDSKHLRDTSTLKDNSAIKLPITRYSSELKEFMERFCHPENKRTINEEGGMRLAGIQIDLARVMRIIFDEQGTKFSKDFNYPKVYTNIRLTANFDKGSDGHNFGKLRYIEITKSTKSAIEEAEPKPKKSFKAI